MLQSSVALASVCIGETNVRYLEHLYLLSYKVGHWFCEDAVEVFLGQTLEGYSDRQTTL